MTRLAPARRPLRSQALEVEAEVKVLVKLALLSRRQLKQQKVLSLLLRVGLLQRRKNQPPRIKLPLKRHVHPVVAERGAIHEQAANVLWLSRGGGYFAPSARGAVRAVCARHSCRAGRGAP